MAVATNRRRLLGSTDTFGWGARIRLDDSSLAAAV